MSTLAKQEQDTSLVALHKKIKELSKKDDMTLPEALTVINYYDGKLAKEHGKISAKPISKLHEISNPLPHLTVITAAGTGLFSAVCFLTGGDLQAWELLVGAGLSFLVGVVPGFLWWANESSERGLSAKTLKLFKPKKYKQAVEDYQLDTEFHNLAKQEYADAEKKIQKRVRKALTVANSRLKAEEIVLENGRFVAKEKNMTSMEKILVRESNSSDSSSMQLASLPGGFAMKALASTPDAG